MSKILVILEGAGQELRNDCLSGIQAAKELATARSAELHLLVLGGANAKALADAVAAKGFGAKAVHCMSDAALEPFCAETWADAIVHAVKTLDPEVVGAAASSATRDALPRAAAMLDLPMFSEIVDARGPNTLVRPISAGRALSVEESANPRYFFTARASEFEAAADGGSCGVEELSAPELKSYGVEVLRVEKTESSRPGLSEAKVVVAGGRGMQSGDNFKHLEELTDLLGGALGASRAATDAGMVPADLQVGQTGKIVAPDLYIAVGISGAIQHLAGMKSSKVIVAINKDAEAPIFQIADYGLVAKWEDTLPTLIEKIKAHKGA